LLDALPQFDLVVCDADEHRLVRDLGRALGRAPAARRDQAVSTASSTVVMRRFVSGS
jgi:hypothetical protein